MKKTASLIFTLLLGTAMVQGEGTAGISGGAAWEDENADPFTSASLSFSDFLYTDSSNTVHLAISADGSFFLQQGQKDYALQALLVLSHLSDSLQMGLQGSAWNGHQESLDTDTLGFGINFPLIWNFQDFAIKMTPTFGMDLSQERPLSAGTQLNASFMWGEFIVSPIIGGTGVWYSSSLQTVALSPSFRLAWFPGFPLSTEVKSSFFWQTSGAEPWSYSHMEGEVLLDAAPFDSLIMSILTFSEFGQDYVLFRGSLQVEILAPLMESIGLSFPFTLSANHSSDWTGALNGGIKIIF